jgi:hypothetical protein
MRIQSGGGESLMLASDCESSVRSQAVSLEVHEALWFPTVVEFLAGGIECRTSSGLAGCRAGS